MPYRELVGNLVYLTNTTRLDLAFIVNALSHFNANPRKIHWKAAKHTLKYLIGTCSLGIAYIKFDKPLPAYVDSDRKENVDNRGSCSGLLILAEGPIS